MPQLGLHSEILSERKGEGEEGEKKKRKRRRRKRGNTRGWRRQ
jgi:hypothetical protein